MWENRVYPKKDKSLSLSIGSYEREKKKLSSLKATNGQQFPCPALLSPFMGGGRAAAPIGDKVL